MTFTNGLTLGKAAMPAAIYTDCVQSLLEIHGVLVPGLPSDTKFKDPKDPYIKCHGTMHIVAPLHPQIPNPRSWTQGSTHQGTS